MSAIARWSALFFFVLFAVPAFAVAGETPNWTITFSFDLNPVEEGGAYSFPLGGRHTGGYTWPGGSAYGEIYKGKLHQGSTRITNHFFSSFAGDPRFERDSFPENGDYFVVIREFDGNPLIAEWLMQGTSSNPLATPPGGWGILRFHVGPRQQPPAISDLQQFREFGVESIEEGEVFIGNAAVFKAGITDPDSASTQMEVELKPTDETFNGSNTVFSSASAPGEFVVTVDELIPVAQHYQSGGNEQSFRWRARAIDAEGNASEWQEFGSNTLAIDFTATVVPLWTQQISNFPARNPADEWAGRDYAAGSANTPGDCGQRIEQCGCAITSAIMIANYYGVQNGADGLPLNPLNFDAWLLEHSAAYARDGSFTWEPLNRYTKGNLAYRDDKRFDIPQDANYQNTAADFARLDEYVARTSEPVPVIGKTAGFKSHGGISRTHFFVIDSKIASTYTIRDPYWFETETLNEPVGELNRVRRYEGSFDGLRIYEPSDTPVFTPYISYALASPAELLYTDAEGRRLGKDPRTGEVFNEIPGGSYTEDDVISDPNESVPGMTARSAHKTILISNPPEGTYTLEVIGTGTGEYSLMSDFTDSVGQDSGTVFHGATEPGMVALYDGSYSPEDVAQSEVTEEKSPEQLFQELKGVVQATATNPPLLRTAIRAGVVTAERLYEKGRIPLTRLTLAALERMVEENKGKHIATEDADALLQLINELQERLKHL